MSDHLSQSSPEHRTLSWFENLAKDLKAAAHTANSQGEARRIISDFVKEQKRLHAGTEWKTDYSQLMNIYEARLADLYPIIVFILLEKVPAEKKADILAQIRAFDSLPVTIGMERTLNLFACSQEELVDAEQTILYEHCFQLFFCLMMLRKIETLMTRQKGPGSISATFSLPPPEPLVTGAIGVNNIFSLETLAASQPSSTSSVDTSLALQSADSVPVSASAVAVSPEVTMPLITDELVQPPVLAEVTAVALPSHASKRASNWLLPGLLVLSASTAAVVIIKHRARQVLVTPSPSVVAVIPPVPTPPPLASTERPDVPSVPVTPVVMYEGHLSNSFTAYSPPSIRTGVIDALYSAPRAIQHCLPEDRRHSRNDFATYVAGVAHVLAHAPALQTANWRVSEATAAQYTVAVSWTPDCRHFTINLSHQQVNQASAEVAMLDPWFIIVRLARPHNPLPTTIQLD